ncbi:hypothetical protein MFMK1_002991 [Metallumcola ferriviriculae]|uniref:Uncharacterized protein n=1 Tax=Metallumcola ferriviriculae TaxID=3039180 RepID=A0AAU0URK1_9FIRM|nr:hypothetical protein MFMK1_002991 [Desulfitibacteraceae bacterium MK1]
MWRKASIVSLIVVTLAIIIYGFLLGTVPPIQKPIPGQNKKPPTPTSGKKLIEDKEHILYQN